jgi:hypothetical protein
MIKKKKKPLHPVSIPLAYKEGVRKLVVVLFHLDKRISFKRGAARILTGSKIPLTFFKGIKVEVF